MVERGTDENVASAQPRDDSASARRLHRERDPPGWPTTTPPGSGPRLTAIHRTCAAPRRNSIQPDLLDMWGRLLI